MQRITHISYVECACDSASHNRMHVGVILGLMLLLYTVFCLRRLVRQAMAQTRLCVCVCVCVCVCLCVCVYECMRPYWSVSLLVGIYMCTFACVCMCVCVCFCICEFFCICLLMYVSACVCVFYSVYLYLSMCAHLGLCCLCLCE